MSANIAGRSKNRVLVSSLLGVILYVAAENHFLRLEARLVCTDARGLGRRNLVVLRTHRHFHPAERDRIGVRSRPHL